jgi:hypothetical protein
MCHCFVVPKTTREDMRVVRPHLCRRIGDPNLVARWVEPDASVRMGRTAGEAANDAPVWSDHIRCVRTIYVGPLEMPLGLEPVSRLFGSKPYFVKLNLVVVV